MLKPGIPKFVFFDMDGTLIEEETIDELARMAGYYEKVSEITDRAMQGEMDFSQALRSRVALLEGQPSSIFNEVYKRFTLRVGVEEFCAHLKRIGCQIYLVSGGFLETARMLQNRLNLDGVHANQLTKDQSGVLTGGVTGEIVDGASKARFVEEISHKFKISREQIWVFGDGANDIEMFGKAGFRVGVRPKKALEAHCDLVLMDGSYLGLSKRLGI